MYHQYAVSLITTDCENNTTNCENKTIEFNEEKHRSHKIKYNYGKMYQYIFILPIHNT